jgi:hypothetical protein
MAWATSRALGKALSTTPAAAMWPVAVAVVGLVVVVVVEEEA